MNNEKKLTKCIITKIEGVKDEKPYKFYTLDVIIEGYKCKAFFKEDLAKEVVNNNWDLLYDYDEE